MNRLLLLSTALGATLALPLQAQQVFDLDEITFSANRTETILRRAGVPVSVVTADDIAQTGAQTVQEVLSRLPGVSYAQSGGLGQQTSFRLRGLSERYVAVYVDGIRIDDPTLPQTYTNFAHLTSGDIGRLELVRGSQSALWGSSAVAGVINISSHRAQQDGWSQEVSLEAGSYRTIAARYGLFYRDDRADIAFGLNHLETEGFSAADTLPKTPEFEPDAYTNSRLSFALDYRLTDQITVGGSVFARRFYNEFDGFVSGGATPATANADNLATGEEIGARVYGRYALGAMTHELSVGYYTISRISATPRTTAFPTLTRGDRYEIAYQGSYEMSPALSFNFGVDHKSEIASANGVSSRQDITGAWAQMLWSPNDSFDLSLNGRLDANSAFGTFPSLRAAAAWRAHDALTLRASAAQGFRAPSLSEVAGSTWTAPSPDLTPETSLSFDIGAEYRPSDRFALSVGLFDIAIDNQIIFCNADCPQPVPPGFFGAYTNRSGISRSRGLELGTELKLSDRQSLQANYTYTDSRDSGGNRLLRVPEHSATITLTSQWTDRLSTGLSAQHIGGLLDVGSVIVPNYTVANLRINYALTDKADLTLRVDNLFNEQYQVVNGYGTSERAFYVGLAARF